MELSFDLHIDGNFEGNIFSKHQISIGQSANVMGFILADEVIISGKFNGQIDCQLLEVKAGAEVNGEVKAEILNVETGAVFTGYSHKIDSQDFYHILPKYVKKQLKNNQILLTNNSEEIEEGNSHPKLL